MQYTQKILHVRNSTVADLNIAPTGPENSDSIAEAPNIKVRMRLYLSASQLYLLTSSPSGQLSTRFILYRSANRFEGRWCCTFLVAFLPYPSQILYHLGRKAVIQFVRLPSIWFICRE
jgi:hypothetical protein